MKKQTSISILVFSQFLLLPLSSCMHTMMMGGHDSHSGHESVTVTKEISSGENSLSITIPQMAVGTEGIISITLQSKSAIPDSVELHYMISKSSSDEQPSGHNHSSETESNEFKTIHERVLLKQGTLSIALTPTQPGQFHFSAEISKISSPFSTELSFIVHEKESMGMMGMGTMWRYPVLGILVMGTMMVGMWAIRGWI